MGNLIFHFEGNYNTEGGATLTILFKRLQFERSISISHLETTTELHEFGPDA